MDRWTVAMFLALGVAGALPVTFADDTGTPKDVHTFRGFPITLTNDTDKEIDDSRFGKVPPGESRLVFLSDEKDPKKGWVVGRLATLDEKGEVALTLNDKKRHLAYSTSEVLALVLQRNPPAATRSTVT